MIDDNNITKRKVKMLIKGSITYWITYILSTITAGALAIFIYISVNNLNIFQWQKGLILIAIGIVSLIIWKLAFKNRAYTNEQNTDNNHSNTIGIGVNKTNGYYSDKDKQEANKARDVTEKHT